MTLLEKFMSEKIYCNWFDSSIYDLCHFGELIFPIFSNAGIEGNGKTTAISLWYLSKHEHYKIEVAGQMLSLLSSGHWKLLYLCGT